LKENSFDPLKDGVKWKELSHGMKVLKSSRPEALMSLLVDDTNYQDKDFIDTFLFTYDYWTDSVSLLKMLIGLFRSPKNVPVPISVQTPRPRSNSILQVILNITDKNKDKKNKENREKENDKENNDMNDNNTKNNTNNNNNNNNSSSEVSLKKKNNS